MKSILTPLILAATLTANAQTAPTTPFSYQVTYDVKSAKVLELGVYRIGKLADTGLTVNGFLGAAGSDSLTSGGCLSYTRSVKGLDVTLGLGFAAFSTLKPHAVLLLGISGRIGS